MKGIAIGLSYTSDVILKRLKKTDFIDQIYIASSISEEKIEKNKQNYESENFRRDLSELFKKYFYIIPILALVIIFIVMKYRSNDE